MKHIPSPGNTYAVHSGVYAGEMLIFIEKGTYNYNFLAVPTMLNRSVPVTSFNLAWNNDIIKYVEQVPTFVQQITKEQYNENEKLNNRRE